MQSITMRIGDGDKALWDVNITDGFEVEYEAGIVVGLEGTVLEKCTAVACPLGRFANENDSPVGAYQTGFQ